MSQWKENGNSCIKISPLPLKIISIAINQLGERNGNPLQCSFLENPRDGGAWWAAIYGVAESDTTEATWKQQPH